MCRDDYRTTERDGIPILLPWVCEHAARRRPGGGARGAGGGLREAGGPGRGEGRPSLRRGQVDGEGGGGPHGRHRARVRLSAAPHRAPRRHAARGLRQRMPGPRWPRTPAGRSGTSSARCWPCAPPRCRSSTRSTPRRSSRGAPPTASPSAPAPSAGSSPATRSTTWACCANVTDSTSETYGPQRHRDTETQRHRGRPNTSKCLQAVSAALALRRIWNFLCVSVPLWSVRDCNILMVR